MAQTLIPFTSLLVMQVAGVMQGTRLKFMIRHDRSSVARTYRARPSRRWTWGTHSHEEGARRVARPCCVRLRL